MRIRTITVLASALLISGIARGQAQADRISTRSTGEDSFEISLESETDFDLANAVRRIAPTAREICGNRAVELGRYTFEASQAVTGDPSGDSFKLVQSIRCVDAVPGPPASVRRSQLEGEDALEAVRGIVRELSREYFDRLYANMGDDAQAALAAMGSAGGSDASAVFETEAGTPVEINLYRLSVYDNLPNAPADGVYVAVDYDNRVGNVANHCGYLMWHSPDAEEFTLSRIESGTLGEELVDSMSEDQVYAVRKQLRCANFYDE